MKKYGVTRVNKILRMMINTPQYQGHLDQGGRKSVFLLGVGEEEVIHIY